MLILEEKGVHRFVKYNKINSYVNPFCPGNQVTNGNSPFLPCVITGRLMLKISSKALCFILATFADMKGDTGDLEKEPETFADFVL